MKLSTNFTRLIVYCAMLFSTHGLTGCATVGKDFPVSRVMEIQIGKTTINEVQAIFGPPWRVGSENGAKTWSYGHYTYRLFEDSSTQDLIVRFDSSGIVRSYNFNTTANK